MRSCALLLTFELPGCIFAWLTPAAWPCLVAKSSAPAICSLETSVDPKELPHFQWELSWSTTISRLHDANAKQVQQGKAGCSYAFCAAQ